MRIFGVALERGAERFLYRGVGVSERARQFAQDRVADDHRRQLAASDHISADRNGVAAEMLDDPLIETLVAATEQRQRPARPPAR